MPKPGPLKGLRTAYLNGTFPQALAKNAAKKPGRACRILYVMRGALLIRAHGAVAQAVGGTLVFFPPDFDGGHRISGDAEAWSLNIDVEIADAWIRKELAPLEREDACCWHAHLEPARQARWESRFQYLQSAGAGATKEALRGALLDVRRAMSASPDGDDEIGDAVLHHIYEHYREDISLASVATAMGYSPAYLTDRVKRETGLPVHRWLLFYRIAEAKHLLRDTALPVEQVAQSVGFSSGNYFSRQFIKVAAESPAAWRAAQRRVRELPDAAHRFNSPHAPWGLQLDAVIDAIPQIAWVKDASGALLFANKRWFDFSGLSEEESGGWGWTAVIHPDDVTWCVGEWRSALRSRTAIEYVARIRRSDGHYRTHLFRTAPYRTPDGSLFWVGTATDLEDRLRANHPTAGSGRSPETSAST